MSKVEDYQLEAARVRFERFVMPEPNSGCWLWMGCVGKSRNAEYGKFNLGREQQAHRVSHVLWNGPIPTGAIVRHKCDNTYCVNPDHLETGTASDNVQDCIKRHRHVAPTGNRHGRAKYSVEFVARVKSSIQGGMSLTETSRKFGVPLGSIARLRDGWPDAEKLLADRRQGAK